MSDEPRYTELFECPRCGSRITQKHIIQTTFSAIYCENHDDDTPEMQRVTDKIPDEEDLTVPAPDAEHVRELIKEDTDPDENTRG